VGLPCSSGYAQTLTVYEDGAKVRSVGQSVGADHLVDDTIGALRQGPADVARHVINTNSNPRF